MCITSNSIKTEVLKKLKQRLNEVLNRMLGLTDIRRKKLLIPRANVSMAKEKSINMASSVGSVSQYV